MFIQKVKTFFLKRIEIICLVIGLGVLVLTIIYTAQYYHNPTHHVPNHVSRDVNAIQDWMTIHYIARAYGVPDQVLLNAIGINQQQATHQSIKAIAQMQGKSSDQLLKKIRAAIQQYKGLP